MKSTKSESLKKTKSSIGAIQLIVLKAIRDADGDISRSEISARTGIRLSSVTARVVELMDMNLIVVSGKKYDPETDRNVQVLSRIVDASDVVDQVG
jgi:DNA-binding MarR family transcriptional regulator